MTTLVTGGAGYIGSHTVLALKEAGFDVVVLDDMRKGHAGAVPRDVELIRGDVGNYDLVCWVMRSRAIDSVVHFAADSLVGESMQCPEKYWQNNVGGGLALLRAMVDCKVDKIVFSSTAAVYGEPVSAPIEEDHPKNPTSTYGMTKLALEHLLASFGTAYGIRYVSLRYFNAAGADPSGRAGEDHRPETHLIPIILQAALGKRDNVSIFGDDYPTPDGTCIRDYIHVTDLSDAHVLALKALYDGKGSGIYNLGNGTGFSVREVLETAGKVVGKPIKSVVTGRRPGDPAVLVASSTRARSELNWRPRFDDLETIVRTAWEWHKAHPDGYGG